MIRPRFLMNSIVAQLVSVSAFLHSLDPERSSGLIRSLQSHVLPFSVSWSRVRTGQQI
jgi:hypothetical protein